MDTYQIITTCVLVVIILVIYYASMWPRKKQEKELKKMQDNLKEGDKIVTFSGLSGVVDKIVEDRIIVKLYPNGNKISIEKWAIAGIDDRSIEFEK